MTCKDCIHYDNKIQEKTGIVEYHLCTENEPNWKFVKNTDKPCKQFVSKDGTYHDGTYHCPRCGKPVDKWGLCGECEKVKPTDKDEWLTQKFVDDVLEACWESVSK